MNKDIIKKIFKKKVQEENDLKKKQELLQLQQDCDKKIKEFKDNLNTEYSIKYFTLKNKYDYKINSLKEYYSKILIELYKDIDNKNEIIKELRHDNQTQNTSGSNELDQLIQELTTNLNSDSSVNSNSSNGS